MTPLQSKILAAFKHIPEDEQFDFVLELGRVLSGRKKFVGKAVATYAKVPVPTPRNPSEPFRGEVTPESARVIRVGDLVKISPGGGTPGWACGVPVRVFKVERVHLWCDNPRWSFNPGYKALWPLHSECEKVGESENKSPYGCLEDGSAVSGKGVEEHVPLRNRPSPVGTAKSDVPIERTAPSASSFRGETAVPRGSSTPRGSSPVKMPVGNVVKRGGSVESEAERKTRLSGNAGVGRTEIGVRASEPLVSRGTPVKPGSGRGEVRPVQNPYNPPPISKSVVRPDFSSLFDGGDDDEEEEVGGVK